MLTPATLPCPYCGEPTTLLLDASAGDSRYIEDCTVCCRPMRVSVHVDANADATARAERED